jgi:hypothetical protein
MLFNRINYDRKKFYSTGQGPTLKSGQQRQTVKVITIIIKYYDTGLGPTLKRCFTLRVDIRIKQK